MNMGINIASHNACNVFVRYIGSMGKAIGEANAWRWGYGKGRGAGGMRFDDDMI